MSKLKGFWPGALKALGPPCEAAVVGVAIGIWDIHSTGNPGMSALAYLLAGVALGARHAGTAWLCWPPLGLSLYAVHLAAIAHGYKQPYVEADSVAARATLGMFAEAGLGIALGVGLRLVLSALGWFRRADGSPVRILPRTPRRIVATLVVAAILFRFWSWISFDIDTVYSKGFTAGRFRQIRVGMPAEEVESILGPPLDKVDRWGGEIQNWRYTNQALPTSDYWRRWIFMKEGKVERVISDYWWD